ncbi:MAG TPA: glycosyltransferase family 2 protein, partial [Flavisolibacter sp.]|nr:glycosyltransferase family 2 protein [Flavisolibacter sp.]
MKPSVSVAIMCKNAGAGIAATIESVLPLSDDVVVYDTGSTDDTVQIAKRYPVRIDTGEWQGYGKTRNTTIQKTRHNWVLTIDADETAEPGLLTEIEQLSLDDPNLVYAVRLRNFLSGKEYFWGDWRNDFRVRLFHKQAVRWNDAIIHEKLLLPAGTKVK